MLKSKKTPLQSLIIISFSAYMSYANAIDTVLDYEKSLTQHSNTAAEVSFTESEQWQQTKQKFKDAGWDVLRDADGSIRLYPQQIQTAESEPKELAEANNNLLSADMQKQLKAMGWGVTRDPDGSVSLYPPAPEVTKESSESDQWQQTKQKFNDAGWDVFRDADGSIRLYPQQIQAAESETNKSAEEDKTPVNIENNSLLSADMQKQLKAMGWGVTRDPDGSVSLYPPAPEVTKESSESDQWQQTKQKFNDAGWDVFRDADGSIRLYPQQIQAAESETNKSAEEDKTPVNVENNSLLSADMEKQFEAKGWGVSRASDGSISLYPPAQEITKESSESN